MIAPLQEMTVAGVGAGSVLSGLTGPMTASAPMRTIFSDRTRVQRMLDVEAALAQAQAACGVIPASAAAAIVAACDADRIEFVALAEIASNAGNLAIPLVTQLTALVATDDPEAAKFVHWGATSQDIIDSGLMLQLRDALTVIDLDLDLLNAAVAHLARRHQHTVMIGRTWMQHALPITFGLKAAGWLDALVRHRARLAHLRSTCLALQFGGAAGTLASLGADGAPVAAALAGNLDLPLPDLPWHAQRDRLAEVASTLGGLVGSLGKMARDISLLSQTEIAEVAEPTASGRGGSSAMPHKRNPVGCAVALAAAVRVPPLVSTMLASMVQEHERALGGWQAEWDTLPLIFQLCSGALQQMRLVASGLVVDEARMRSNLDATHGLIFAEAVSMALAERIGRTAAHKLVEEACHRAISTGIPLRTTLAVDAVRDPSAAGALDSQQLDTLFDPQGYIGQAAAMVERVLNTYQAGLPGQANASSKE